MVINNKLTITLLLLITIAFFHCLASRLEVEEFEPPEQEGQQGPGGRPGGGSGEGWDEGTTNNPYHFREWSFKNFFQSKEGFVKMLPKFTKRSSTLFRGIQNYRFLFMEMEPNTFFMPHHVDADYVFLVLQGEGVIGFVTDKTKESFQIAKGDVVRVPPSVTHFFTNTNATVPLRLAKIVVPVNTPGHFQINFPARSQFQQSYFTGFSKETLSASFNIPEELVGRFIRGSQQQGEGIIRRVSPDQIKELTEHATSPSNKHKDKKEKHKDKGRSTILSPFSIFTQDATIYSNDFGRFHEVHPDRFSQLQDLDISVAWANMTKGSLFLPQYNSKTTFVTFVENGCARFEMASPYKFQEEQQQQQPWFGPGQEEEEEEEEEMSGQVHKIVSRVCKGEVFIIPAGHPFAIVSDDENFVSVGFGIHASNGTRTFLAGQDNMLSNLNTVATRLSFGVGSKMAEKLFTSQNYSYFAPTTPRHQFPEKRKPSFQSIFNLAGF